MTRRRSRTRGALQAALALLAVLAVTLLPLPARAESPQIDLGVTVGQGQPFVPGMVETYVRIHNPAKAALSGKVRVVARELDDDVATATAEFSAAGQSTALVRVPLGARHALRIEVTGVNGTLLAQLDLSATPEVSVRVFDVSEPSRLRPSIENAQMHTSYTPPTNPGIGGSATPSGGPRLRVYGAHVDPATGEPLLPLQAASWHGMHAVFIASHSLVALGDEEMEALTTYVLGGGTLAVSIDRPDDLRNPELAKLIGGEAALRAAPEECFRPVQAPVFPGRAPRGSPVAPRDSARPAEDTPFTSYAGGNLRPTVFGASASYGLGEVHLLGFDPNNPLVAGDPWVTARLLELARRGFERSYTSTSRVGETPMQKYPGAGFDESPFDAVRRLLDPNRRARWGVVIASLLLCVYAVIAGPVMFARAKKQNRPLAALRMLPILSAGTFLLVVLLGMVSKGVSTVSNRLTVVDLGAGMSSGAGRRYRAFFSSGAQSIDATQSDRTSMLVPAMQPRAPYALEVDRDSVKVVDLESEPAQTVVLREDGLIRLRGSVDIREAENGSIVIENHFEKPLQALVIRLPDGSFRFEKSLAPGASVSSDAMARGKTRFTNWTRNFSGGPPPPIAVGGPKPMPVPPSAPSSVVRGLGDYLFQEALSSEGEGDTGEAWLAVEEALGPTTEWFPNGVPALIAEVRGGADNVRDSGVGIRSDRLLVRVVGYGVSP